MSDTLVLVERRALDTLWERAHAAGPLAWAEQCADGKLRHGVHGLTQDGTEPAATAKRYTETEAAAMDRARRACGPHQVVGIYVRPA